MAKKVKHIRFDEVEGHVETREWIVRNHHNGAVLGEVVWFEPWTAYVYRADKPEVLNEGSLRELLEFVHKATTDKRRVAQPKRVKASDVEMIDDRAV